MPGDSQAVKDLFVAINSLVKQYNTNAATIATLAGLAAGATDPQIQALNTAMPSATSDLSSQIAAFNTWRKTAV